MSAQTFKILVTGPFAAGKTSLIQSVSQTPVVTTDVDTSGDESDVKSRTTVAMDFGTYWLKDDERPSPAVRHTRPTEVPIHDEHPEG